MFYNTKLQKNFYNNCFFGKNVHFWAILGRKPREYGRQKGSQSRVGTRIRVYWVRRLRREASRRRRMKRRKVKPQSEEPP